MSTLDAVIVSVVIFFNFLIAYYYFAENFMIKNIKVFIKFHMDE